MHRRGGAERLAEVEFLAPLAGALTRPHRAAIAGRQDHAAIADSLASSTLGDLEVLPATVD